MDNLKPLKISWQLASAAHTHGGKHGDGKRSSLEDLDLDIFQPVDLGLFAQDVLKALLLGLGVVGACGEGG